MKWFKRFFYWYSVNIGHFLLFALFCRRYQLDGNANIQHILHLFALSIRMCDLWWMVSSCISEYYSIFRFSTCKKFTVLRKKGNLLIVPTIEPTKKKSSYSLAFPQRLSIVVLLFVCMHLTSTSLNNFSMRDKDWWWWRWCIEGFTCACACVIYMFAIRRHTHSVRFHIFFLASDFIFLLSHHQICFCFQCLFYYCYFCWLAYRLRTVGGICGSHVIINVTFHSFVLCYWCFFKRAKEKIFSKTSKCDYVHLFKCWSRTRTQYTQNFVHLQTLRWLKMTADGNVIRWHQSWWHMRKKKLGKNLENYYIKRKWKKFQCVLHLPTRTIERWPHMISERGLYSIDITDTQKRTTARLRKVYNR